MMFRFVSITLFSYLFVNPVLGSIFCKHSVIDAITNVNEMWFIVSEGHYWWISTNEFPPSDRKARKLPDPFKKPTSAVYIDSKDGCPSRRIKGVRAREREIWISEMMDNKIMLRGYDTRNFEWTPEPVPIEHDHCIGRAKIEFHLPIDAMFSRNDLEIYVVQGDHYSMVDCSYLCTNSELYGSAKDPKDIKDWESNKPIDGMFIRKTDKMLYSFQKNVFYKMKIEGVSNGRLTASKTDGGQLTNSVLFKVNSSEECISLTTIPFSENTTAKEVLETKKTEEIPNNTEIESDVKDSDPENGFSLLGIVVIVVVLIFALIGCCCICLICGLCAVCGVKPSKKKGADVEALPSGAKKSGSKADIKVSKVGEAKSTPPSVGGTAPSKQTISSQK